MKELVYHPPILCVASKFVCDITAKRFIGWGKNGKLLSLNLDTKKNVVLKTVTI